MRALVFRTGLPRLVWSMAHSRLTGYPPTSGFAPLTLAQRTLPPIDGGRLVRVRTHLGGICGSDLHMLKVEVSRHASVVAARRDSLGATTFPGHEAVGEVVAVGPGVERVRVGQRVVLVPGVFCSALDGVEPCACCRQGHLALCRRRQERPYFFSGGGWSEEFVRHESQVVPVPDEIPDETAVLIEPAGCALHALLRRPPKNGERALVVGSGMIGLGIVAAVRALHMRVRVTILCRHRFQAERALALGADDAVGHERGDPYDILAETLATRVQGRQRHNRYLVDGFDVVYDCVGSARSLHDGIRWCKPRGAVVLEGIDMFPGTLDRTQIWRRELDILGAIGHGPDEWDGERRNTFDRVIDWLRSGRLCIDGLLTHRFSLGDYSTAIRTALDKARTGAIRAAFDFRSGSSLPQ